MEKNKEILAAMLLEGISYMQEFFVPLKKLYIVYIIILMWVDIGDELINGAEKIGDESA
ncbi:MAG: hypothetical protein KJ630_01845 [Proteobacteria bacterium]|nr:hypothetical protein [Pseudomonadota bacterium]